MSRPRVIDETKTTKLEAALQRGLSVATACEIAHIAQSTYFKTVAEVPEFAERMNDAKNFGKVLAAQTVTEALKNKDLTTARWYLEHKEEGFGQQLKLTQNNTQVNVYNLNSPEVADFNARFKEFLESAAPTAITGQTEAAEATTEASDGVEVKPPDQV